MACPISQGGHNYCILQQDIQHGALTSDHEAPDVKF